MRADAPTSFRTARVLGVTFFDGSVAAAVEQLQQTRGYVVVPAAPALVKLRYDPEFRAALTEADMAIADSGLMVLLWKLLRGQRLSRISGLAYLKQLLAVPSVRGANATFWILPTDAARDKAASWLHAGGLNVGDDRLYVAPRYEAAVADPALLALLERLRPAQIIIAIGGGAQEKLARYLKLHCTFGPAIHCVGAALGFLTGDQVAIPDWADRLYLGWLLRLFAQPRIFIPRLATAWRLPLMIIRYGSDLPPLRPPRHSG